MEDVTPEQITWSIVPEARGQIKALPPEVHAHYGEMLTTFKETVCNFINTTQDCDGKALGVSPLGGYGKGGKYLKVRVALFGRGKSGSLRVLVVACCEVKEVVALAADMRKDL